MADFHVPGISEEDPVGKRAMAPVAEKAFPGHIETNIKRPDHWAGKPDFIPSAGRKRQILEARGLLKRKKDPKPGKVNKVHGVDHMTYEAGQKLLKKKGSRIRKMAKEMMQERADDIKRFARAEEIVKASTLGQRGSCKPGSRLHRAMSILDAGPPMTHDRALRESRDRVFKDHS